LLNFNRQIFHAYSGGQNVQHDIKQMQRNKRGASTFDCYWKSCWENWERMKQSSLISDYNAPTLGRNVQKWCPTCKERCKLRTWHPL